MLKRTFTFALIMVMLVSMQVNAQETALNNTNVQTVKAGDAKTGVGTVYSTDYRIMANGECMYGVTVINGEYYIPLELFNSMQTVESGYIQYENNEDKQECIIKIYENKYNVPKRKLSVAGNGFSWVEMGTASTSGMSLDIEYNDRGGIIDKGILEIDGRFPMVKVRELSQIIPISFDNEARIIYIGNGPDAYIDIAEESDLLNAAYNVFIKREAEPEENVRAAHDYIVRWLYYNNRVNDYDMLRAKSMFYFRNNVGLAGRGGICEDYSMLFREFCRRMGTPCILVTGEADGIDHMWNMVYIGGKWQYVDATWDDPASNGKGSELVIHKYYLISPDELSKTHIWKGGDYKIWVEADENKQGNQEDVFKE